MKIGIVTLSYNQAAFLEEAIHSVASGQEAGLEYVIVDPGSTDGSRDIIAKHAKRFTQIILQRDDGPADGLNKGFGSCSADVFGYLNADDRFAPGCLEFVEEVFSSRPEVDVLCGSIRIIREDGTPMLRGRTPDRMDVRRYAVGASFVWQQGCFFRRRIFEKVGGFNVANRSCWDGELAVDFALAGARFARVNKWLGDFRLYPSSITGSNRHKDAYREDQRRIAGKIYACGFRPYSRWHGLAVRIGYRCDLLRHLREVFV